MREVFRIQRPLCISHSTTHHGNHNFSLSLSLFRVLSQSLSPFRFWSQLVLSFRNQTDDNLIRLISRAENRNVNSQQQQQQKTPSIKKVFYGKECGLAVILPWYDVEML